MEMDKKQEKYKRQNAWIREKAERISLLFEKGTKERIQVVADAEGISISEYVRKAVEARLTGSENILPDSKLFSSDKKDLIIEAAKISGLSVKDFIREAVYSKAEEIVKEAKREDET